MIFPKGRIAGLVFTVATLIGALLILHETGVDSDLDGLQGLLDARVLAGLFMLYATHFIAEPARWAVYTRAGTGADITRIFACFNITALLSYSLPFKLGLPLRFFMLSHYLGTDNREALRLMMLDGALALLCWAVVAVPLMLLLPEITRFIAGNFDLVLWPILVLVPLALWWARKALSRLWSTLRQARLALVVFVVAILLVDIALYGVRHAVLAPLLGIEVAADTVFVIGIIAVFAGIVSTLPMGLGAYDATLVALLAVYGVGVESALVLALGNRLGMIVTSVVLGVPSSLLLRDKRAP